MKPPFFRRKKKSSYLSAAERARNRKMLLVMVLSLTIFLVALAAVFGLPDKEYRFSSLDLYIHSYKKPTFNNFYFSGSHLLGDRENRYVVLCIGKAYVFAMMREGGPESFDPASTDSDMPLLAGDGLSLVPPPKLVRSIREETAGTSE